MSSEYTVEEVQKHTAKDDLWIIIDGHVYDVTEWQADHPGGKKMLQKVGGKDASKQFHKYHDVDNVMRKFGVKYRIGKITANAASASVPKSQHASSVVPKTIPTPLGQIDLPKLPMPSLSLVKTNAKANVEALEEFGDLIPYADPLWYQGFPSPFYKESHARLRAKIRGFVEEKIIPFVDEWEAKGQIPEQLFTDFGKEGYFAIMAGGGQFPSEYATNQIEDIVATSELDAYHTTIISDEVCRSASTGVVWFIMGGYGIGMPPVLFHGSEELKKRILPGIFKGEKRICLAITEPSGGSDVANLQTTAERTPDGKHFIVNGEKKWITNGIWADYFSVAVRTGGPGMNGISMLLIERTYPGITTRKIETQGARTSGSTYIEFDDVKVPVENLLGNENEGFKVIMGNFNHERMGVVCQAVRFSRVCYEEAVKYAYVRETFGVKLIKHAVIRNKLAQMASRIEGAWALYEALIFQYIHMDPEEAMLRLGGNIAGLKALSTQVFEYCAREATQIFGGLAYTVGGKGGKVERLYRDVRSLAIPGGSEEIMLDLSIRQSLKVGQIYGAKL